MQAHKDAVVSIHYTLTNDKGEVIDSSQGQDPLEYLHGHKNIVSGLEEALEGATVGTELEVSIPPEKGYGSVNPEFVFKLPRAQFEGVDTLQVGMGFVADTDRGPQQLFITAIEGDDIEVDGNHPLAGQTLHFAVKVDGMRESTENERSTGQVEMPEDCQKPCCG